MVALTANKQSDIATTLGIIESGWASWIPRGDNPAEFDEQTAFVNAKDTISLMLGGTGSGKTEAAAYRFSKFLLREQCPPRRDCPVWVVGKIYPQVISVVWAEKLHGKQFIPDCEVDWPRVSWYDAKMRWPLMVPLKPWPGTDRNWVIEFKSYEQGREAMQARSIGGFWLSEQFPFHLLEEIFGRCREYTFPGGQIAEFTPLNADLCLGLEKIVDNPPIGWKLYRLNTEKNRVNLSEQWFESFFSSVSPEMYATRMTGALAAFRGAIYPSFNVNVHVTKGTIRIPVGCHHYRGFDWGFSEEHPFAGVWLYVDSMGDFHVYDEYWSIDQMFTGLDHAKAIMARSLAWGWPTPDEVLKPEREMNEWGNSVIAVANDMNPQRAGMSFDEKGEPKYRAGEYGQSFAGHDRPDMLRTFNQCGINVSQGVHEVVKGIEEVRRVLAINPTTNKPRLFIHEKCKHLIEEMRRYHWDEADDDPLKPKKSKKPQPFKAKDDTVDALRMAIYNVQKNRGSTIDSIAQRNDDHSTMEGQFSRHKGNSAARRMMKGMR